MKSIFKSVLLLGVMMAAYSCVLDDIDTQMTDEEAIANIKLECDALDSYTVQASKPQAISFRISSTTPWTIEGADKVNWLTVSPASSSVSSLSEDIRITASVNDALADRSATLTVTGKNTSISKKIVITQLRHGKMTVTPCTEVFAKAGSVQTFSVQSNLHWEAVAADSWLTLDPASGDSDGDMKTFSVKATAAENNALTRETTITVTSGDDIETFTVTQNGETLEIVPAESYELNRKGGSLEIGVDATMEWTVSSDNEAFTVVKDSDSKFTVSAEWNNKFASRTATITVTPVGSGFAGMEKTLEVSQGINFSLSGHYEVLSDGSLKMFGDSKARVATKDDYRYVKIVLTMGDKNFGEKGQLWCAAGFGECNIYNQLSLGGNLRIRQDGNLPITTKPSGEAVSTYKNVNHTGIDQAAMNALTEYRFEVLNQITDDPDYPGVKWHVVNFWYNGAINTTLNFRSVLADDPNVSSPYWFGFNDSTTDGSWYVVKSCDVTAIAE